MHVTPTGGHGTHAVRASFAYWSCEHRSHCVLPYDGFTFPGDGGTMAKRSTMYVKGVSTTSESRRTRSPTHPPTQTHTSEGFGTNECIWRDSITAPTLVTFDTQRRRSTEAWHTALACFMVHAIRQDDVTDAQRHAGRGKLHGPKLIDGDDWCIRRVSGSIVAQQAVLAVRHSTVHHQRARVPRSLVHACRYHHPTKQTYTGRSWARVPDRMRAACRPEAADMASTSTCPPRRKP